MVFNADCINSLLGDVVRCEVYQILLYFTVLLSVMNSHTNCNLATTQHIPLNEDGTTHNTTTS